MEYYRNRLEGGQCDFKYNKINLPKFVVIKFGDKFKIKCMMKTDPLPFHTMLRQGFNWFTLASNDPSAETV